MYSRLAKCLRMWGRNTPINIMCTKEKSYFGCYGQDWVRFPVPVTVNHGEYKSKRVAKKEASNYCGSKAFEHIRTAYYCLF